MTPLERVRVADFTESLAGPFCAQILADLGADVVKVERPGGDPARSWGPPFWEGESPMFLSVNRGKRSVMLDLKQPRGREAARRLLGRSDVVLQSFRPGVAESLGLAFSDVQALDPRIVYCDVSAWGQRGPRHEQPGYDPILQAYAGLMSVTGHPGAPPTRLGVSAVDLGTGMWGAIGVLAALAERERTGRGGRVAASLLDTALGLAAYHLTGFLASGRVPGPEGSGLSSIAPYAAFPTRDGWLMIAAANDVLFQRLCSALDVPDLGADPRFRSNPDRVARRGELDGLLGERTRAWTSRELQARLEDAGVPCGPIHDMRSVAADPQVLAAGAVRSVPHPRIPDYRNLALPLEHDGRRWGAERVPPRAGEHTLEVLRELGLGAEEAAATAEECGSGRPRSPDDTR